MTRHSAMDTLGGRNLIRTGRMPTNDNDENGRAPMLILWILRNVYCLEICPLLLQLLQVATRFPDITLDWDAFGLLS